MPDRIRANPTALEAYTEDTLRALDRVRGPLEVAGSAVRALDAASPNELGTSYADPTPAVAGVLDALADLDQAPAAFAGALRRLDTGGGTVLEAPEDLAFVLAVDAELRADTGFEPFTDPRDLLDQIVGDGGVVQKALDRLGKLGEWFQHLPEAVEFVIEEVTSTFRRTTIVVEEFVGGVWRSTLIQVDESATAIRQFVTTFDLSYLTRSAPFLKKLGIVGDVLAFPLSGLEQWQEDADRTDLTSTERWMRTIVDGGARGTVQLGIGMASTSLAGLLVVAAPFTGGLTLIAAGGVIVAGVVIGEVVDGVLEPLLDQFYETRFFEWTAEQVDEIGRGIRDFSGEVVELAGDVRDWGADRWQDTQEGLDDLQDWGGEQLDRIEQVGGEVRDWGGERLDDARDMAGDVRDWGSDRLDDIGDLVPDISMPSISTPW